MPTARPRHQVTETDSVARALDLAQQRWPGEPRSRLLVRLVIAGADQISSEDQRRREERRDAVEAVAGQFTGAFDDGFLTDLREDWPA